MLQIFQKKNFLIDHLLGLVDIHNHILPGIDDGAKNTDDSIALIEALGELGINRFICTPHIMHHYYENTPKSIAKSNGELHKVLKEKDIEVHIDIAAEHMVDDNYETLLDTNTILTLGPSHVLVEMSYLQASINFDYAMERTLQKQLFPILAHPERYVYFHKKPKKYAAFKEEQIAFQMNLLSIGGYYGKEVQKMTLSLLDKGFYDFVGTDVHRMQHIRALKEIKISNKTLDAMLPVINATIETFY
ncbi:MAG: CpsB/CapC family capsule biosynthesis tyrosine phosphatase [Bacteroidota bacterium]